MKLWGFDPFDALFKQKLPVYNIIQPLILDQAPWENLKGHIYSDQKTPGLFTKYFCQQMAPEKSSRIRENSINQTRFISFFSTFLYDIFQKNHLQTQKNLFFQPQSIFQNISHFLNSLYPHNNFTHHISGPMKKVAYLYNDAITNYHFSKEHPMKTKRIKMTHSLIQSYNLCPYLNMFQSRQATRHQLQSFHDPEYVKYLETWVTGKKDQVVSLMKEQERRKIREDAKLKALFKVNQSFDCPGFDGLYNFCQLAVGGSIDAADTIVTGLSDIVVNWSGGYHHAKKTEASGFCYVNDIVVCILQLLRMYPRVLYLDIDVHHGDGVEQAFYDTNRVMTVSFHQFDEDFFPGTGSLESVGEGAGKYYSVNVPLKKGMRDLEYIELFKKVMDKVMGSYRPDVCVIQCGADSLAKDRLGHQNLTIKGHAECVKWMMGYGTPIVFLGGGGYTIENVSRCWAYETSVILGQPIEDQKIPEKDPFLNLYEQDQYNLHFDIESRPNENERRYLDNIYETIVENLRESEIRPSIAFHNAPKRFIPEQNFTWEAIDEEEDSDNDSLCNELFKR